MAEITREQWNKEFAEIIVSKTNIPAKYAMDCAEASDDSFDDGLSPAEAVDEELSAWEP